MLVAFLVFLLNALHLFAFGSHGSYKKFHRKFLLCAGIDISESSKGHVSDVIGRFQHVVKIYAEIFKLVSYN